MKNNSVLGVAEFHKAVLTGTYPKKCLRQFNSWNKKVEWCNEMGIRIMIKDVIFQGAKHEKALVPIYSEDLGDHYRVFFKCKKGASKVDKLLKLIGFIDNIGPLWLGNLWNNDLLKKLTIIPKVIQEESKINTIGYYDIHKLFKGVKASIPKSEKIIEQIKKEGYEASRTHFTPYGIKSNISKEKLKEVIKKLI